MGEHTEEEVALDDLPECPPDKEPRWKAYRGSPPACPPEHLARTEQRNRLAADLESAAIRLRDAELEKQSAGKAYAEALKAFNEFVAPVKP